MTLAKTSVCVRYRGVEGWNVFDSDGLPGLYVASKDAAVAFNDVAPAIEALLFLDEGVECTARPELTLEEFLHSLKGEAAVESPLVMADKRFTVSGMVTA